MANINNISQQNVLTQTTFEKASKKNVISINKPLICPQTINFKGQPEKDSLDLTAKKGAALEKVSTTRAIFSYLDQETIDKVNETGMLPENVMVTQGAYGRYVLTWKDPLTKGQLVGGTQKMPDHLELKRDLLGFTRVVPKGYDHFLIK